MVNVLVNRSDTQNNVNIAVRRSIPVRVSANNPLVVYEAMGGVVTFDELHDVDLTQRTDGSIPVYNESTDTYIVTNLTIIDGGEF